MPTQLRPALTIFVVLTILTGGIYPAMVTGIAQLFFAREAGGSLIVRDKGILGSSLIGQPFADPGHFWSRASGTSPYPYNAASSSGTNQGPTNPALIDAVAARIKALKDADPDNKLAIPADLVTASASGLDPHISPAAAEYQVARVARERKLPVEKVRALVAQHTEGRQLGFLGEPRVNVLELNLALDEAG
jgi:potassium-transporting ATPase KdpC subunit